MELTLLRKWREGDATIGELFVDGVRECYTLEDTVRPGDIFRVKVPGKTAIPAGRYEVQVTYSNRFKRDLPILEDVPNFTGVRIHAGNTAADTEGCILVGRSRSGAFLRESRAALDELVPKIRRAFPDCWITIEDAFEPDPTPTYASGEAIG